jgi:hypothetical protein
VTPHMLHILMNDVGCFVALVDAFMSLTPWMFVNYCDSFHYCF